ncbi:MAG: hypothetical protein ACLFQX_09930 [Candidatus Kapaibacterium sp.]
MKSENIDKILSGGSANKRIGLYFEDKALKSFGKEALLSADDAETLRESFKKAQEVKLFRKFTELSLVITDAVINLQGLMFEVKMHYSNILGYVIVWRTLEESEVIINSVLNEISDPDERLRISRTIANSELFFSRLRPDENGYATIDIDTRHEYENQSQYSFRILMNNVRDEATRAAIRFMSWRAAILDFMKEQNFNINAYVEIIDKYTDAVNSPVVRWDKYLSDQSSFIPDSPAPRLDKFKHIYAVTPNPKEFRVDKNIYTQFKRELLENGVSFLRT